MCSGAERRSAFSPRHSNVTPATTPSPIGGISSTKAAVSAGGASPPMALPAYDDGGGIMELANDASERPSSSSPIALPVRMLDDAPPARVEASPAA